MIASLLLWLWREEMTDVKSLTQPKIFWLFFYLTVITILFIFLEISFFIQSSELYLGDFKLVAYHLKIPLRILPGLFYFLGVQLAIHVAFVVLIGSLASLISLALPRCQAHLERIGLGLWLLAMSTILLANQYFFPDSKFAVLTENIFYPGIAKVLLVILATTGLAVILLAVYGLLIILSRPAKMAVSVLGISLLAIIFFSANYRPVASYSAATAEKPNMIIIGVDALRPDFLGYFGGTKQTPYLDQFLNKAAVFSEALTPLARTYPAWMSILTGQYPKRNGVRFDLAQQIHFDLHKTLPAILHQKGYQTIFATDETRFSNIDQKVGFDQIIAPPTGFNDFLLGTLNDFPMSNLLVNTLLGQYLFPYSYGNRPAYITYDPNTFLNLIKPALAGPHHKPLFLAVHLCLTHFPYLWASRPANTSSFHNYQRAIHRVDQQVHDLLKMLKKNNLLEHSVVVLLSDHGEAFELPGDRVTEPDLFVAGINNPNKLIQRFYPPSTSHERVNQSAGHGTDVLGLSQYHTVLAFRFFGIKGQQTHVIPGRVSLLDIKPTLFNLIGVLDPQPDGKSLLNYIAGKKLAVALQPDFFIETDLTPAAVRSVHPEMRKVLFEGVDYVQINPITTRLTIRQSMIKLILSSKQYADFYGKWVLAVYPQNKYRMTPILVNLETGKWTNDLRTALALQAPVNHMLHALKDFYKDDITTIQTISS
jgi:arylsulfatase A-like enzyme